MKVINDNCEYFFEKTIDFILFENARDSNINLIELPKKKYDAETMEFLFDFYKKDFRIDLKNNAVVYYENAAFDFINDFIQNNRIQCQSVLQLSLFLGYTKLSGMMLLFEHFMPF